MIGAGTKLTCSTDMKLPHAIEFKPDGTRMFVTTNKDHSGIQLQSINLN